MGDEEDSSSEGFDDLLGSPKPKDKPSKSKKEKPKRKNSKSSGHGKDKAMFILSGSDRKDSNAAVPDSFGNENDFMGLFDTDLDGGGKISYKVERHHSMDDDADEIFGDGDFGSKRAMDDDDLDNLKNVDIFGGDVSAAAASSKSKGDKKKKKKKRSKKDRRSEPEPDPEPSPS